MIRNGRLMIFDDFRVDLNLLKHQKTRHDDEEPIAGHSKLGSSMGFMSSDMVVSSSNIDSNGNWDALSDHYNTALDMGQTNAFIVIGFKALWRKIKWLFSYQPKQLTIINDKPSPKLINKIFDNIIQKGQLLNSVASNNDVPTEGIVSSLILELSVYNQLIKQAKDQGQIALVERTEMQWALFLYENILAHCGFNKFITEEDLVKAINYFDVNASLTKEQASDQKKRFREGFALTWIQNFTRFLPNDVVEKKKLADDLMVFDNYVIMHYDPNKAATALTKQEQNAIKRDPILFGVIAESRKLYFIADWVDEFCDLTMKEIVDVLVKSEGVTDADFTLSKDKTRKLLGKAGEELLKEYADSSAIREIAERWADI